MKNKKEILALLIIFGITFVSLSHIFNTNDLNTVEKKIDIKSSNPINQVPFSINDRGTHDWEWAKGKGICTGSGTINDPYIIEDLEINGSNEFSCIEISFSNKYFIVRNCMLYNSRMSFPNPYEASIRLVAVSNGRIYNNTIYDCDTGISLEECDNINVTKNLVTNSTYVAIEVDYSNNNHIDCNIINYSSVGMWVLSEDPKYPTFNNSITKNTIMNIESTGIRIFKYCENIVISDNLLKYNDKLEGRLGTLYVGGNYVVVNNNTIENNNLGINIGGEDNEIINNKVKNNKINGIKVEGDNNLLYKNSFINNSVNAINLGSNNLWDNGSLGNYWDDYIGDDWNFDNIGDTPYFNEENGIIDHFPIHYNPDFAIFPENIIFESGIGETDVNISIINLGGKYDGKIEINFLEEDPDGNISFLDNRSIYGLDKNEEKTISIRWTPKLFHFIIICIDPDYLISEKDKANNVAKKGGGGNSPTIVRIWSDFGVWSDPNTVGYFFSLIPLSNTFYVEIIDLDDDMSGVNFKVAGQDYVGDLYSRNVWEFELNMGILSNGDNRLEITARDNTNLVSETSIITIKIIEIPQWILEFITGDELPIKLEGSKLSLSFDVKAEGGNKSLPDDIPNIGGGGMSPDITIKFTFWYDFLTNKAELTIGGGFEFEGEYAGKDVTITVDISGTGKIRLEGWLLKLDQVEINVTFNLKVTLWGYGAEFSDYCKIGVGIDLEFTFLLLLIFDVVNNAFSWAETKLGLILGVLGYVKFKLDLGFMVVDTSVQGGGGITLDFNWTNEGFSWGFNAYLKFSYKLVFKFLFYSYSSSASYEWWLLEHSPLKVNKTIIEEPLNYTVDYATPIDSRPRVATDNEGDAMMVWIYNREQSGKNFTDLCYSVWNGNDWDEAKFITYDNNSDFDPALTYDSNGNVMVVWSRFKDDIDTLAPENPLDLLASQEIAYSIWNGISWTKPQLLTDDTYANGRAVVSKGKNGDLIAVWVGDPDHNFTTTTDMELFYSVWNGNYWTSKQKITENEYMDYSASLASDSEGNVMICWIRDLDGNRTTTSDTQLLYSSWNGVSWSKATEVVESVDSKESPSITFDLNDNLLVTWVARNETSSKLYFSSLNKSTQEWNIPEIVHEEGFFIFTPAINVDPNNTAVIVWRGFEDDEAEREYYHAHNATETYFDGELCYATKDLTRSDAVWSERKFLTSNNKTDWMASAVIIRGHSNDLLLVWDMDGIVSRLVHEIKPDLYVGSSDIFFSNEHPNEKEEINITATISNIGDVRVNDIQVAFYNGDPKNGGILIGTKSIPVLDYDTKKNVTITWAAQSGSNKIYVVVDHENLISEINETNNKAFKVINILADLTLTSTDISFSNPNPIEGDEVNITAIIHNIGGTRATNISVTFYDNQNVIGSMVIGSLNSGDFNESFVTWITQPGFHNITVVIDQLDEIFEWNETNNNATTIIGIYPDVKVKNFTVSNNIIKSGEDIDFSVEIQNIGATSANDIVVEFYDGNPDIDGILLDTRIISRLDRLHANEIIFSWITPSPGIHKVFIIIDRQNTIKEINESNNLLYQEVMVLNLPDLTISEPDLIHTTDYIEINAPIKDLGNDGTVGIVIELYDGNPSLNGHFLQSKLITYLGAGQSEIVSFTIYEPPTFNDLYITVDPKNTIDELNENNNQLIISYSNIIHVDAGPDQSVSEGDMVHFQASLYGMFDESYNYSWGFGDGFSGVGVNVEHQYGDNGIYNVKLTVEGPNFMGTDDLVVTVSNLPPLVDAGPNQAVLEDSIVSFEGSLFDPGVMDTHTIEWNFGDGTTSSGTLYPTHIYSDSGIYPVTLTIVDDDGGIGTDEVIITVSNVAPIADAGDDQTIYDNETAYFDASGSWDTVSDLPTLLYLWDFGDGSNSEGIFVSHNYSKLGTYEVFLTTIDDDNEISVDSCLITVIDDDTEPPLLSDLSIIHDIKFINITLYAWDQSGIASLNIKVDGEFILPKSEIRNGNSYTIILNNEWILNPGLHEVEIFVTDADDDIAGDNEVSSISGTFTISFDDMKNYVLWELEGFTEEIKNIPMDYWSNESNRNAMINKVSDLHELILENNFDEAYDKLLHDIKPKLTGLKTNEYEEPWGGGTFKNPWIIDEECQEEFLQTCNRLIIYIEILDSNFKIGINLNMWVNYLMSLVSLIFIAIKLK